MKTIQMVMILSILLLTVACGAQTGPSKKMQPDQRVSQDENQIQLNTELAGRAKKAAETVKGVKGSTVVALNREIAAAVKVSGFDRLRLKTIKKEVHEKIKELDPDYNIFVTTDKKIFAQLQQMEKEINEPQEKSLIDLQKGFNKVIKDIQR